MPAPKIEKVLGPAAKRQILKIEKVLGPAATREIFKALGAYNKAATGTSDYRQLAITVRDKGKIVGGLVAETYWNWMYVRSLWLSERHRRKGWGSKLMRTAETEARKRRVRNVFLDSFTFQAPGFYAKLGYREFGRLKDFPVGHDRVYMTKAL
jgi:ribosomal protein S18 acetylase RimI-like enzyme